MPFTFKYFLHFMDTTTEIDTFGEVNQPLGDGNRHVKIGFSLNGIMIHWRLTVENSTHLHFDQGHMEFKPLGKSIALERSSLTHTRVFMY